MFEYAKFEELNFQLIDEYTELLSTWYETRDAELVAKMNTIRETIDIIAYGMQVNMMQQQMKAKKSGLVVPQANINLQ